MEEMMVIERGVSIYLIFYGGIDSIVLFIQLSWPITCFIIQDHLSIQPKYIGLYSGLFPFIYTLGKFLSYKSILNLSTKFNHKWLIFFLILGSSFSVVLFGFVNDFVGFLVCRFFSGIFSNFSQIIRKFLIFSTPKDDISSILKKALWANRIGNIIGLLLFGFLTIPDDFLQPDSQFIQKRYLIPCLISFLFGISGCLLVFSIESREFPKKNTKKYAELPEVKENGDDNAENKAIETTADQTAKRLSRLIRNLPENIQNYTQEIQYSEEIKFYSPKNSSNLGEIKRNSRRFNSINVNTKSKFNFQVIKKEKNEEEGKKTHISFIEDELEEIKTEENKENHIPNKSDVNIEKESEIRDIDKTIVIKFAKRFRILLTFMIGVIYESIPVCFFIKENGDNLYEYSEILLLLFGLAAIIHLSLSESILLNISVIRILSFCLYLTIFVSGLLIISDIFSGFLIIYILSDAFLLVIAEFLAPIGSIMVADSIENSTREESIEKNNFFCIATKAIGSYLGTVLISTGNLFSITYILIPIFCTFLLLLTKQIPDYFHALTVAPYKI